MRDVRDQLNDFFAPDMRMEFKMGVWICKPLTALGEAWNKRYRGVIMKGGFMIGKPIFEDCYNSMLHCGLTVETYDGFEE